jgi:hypothetical protein
MKYVIYKIVEFRYYDEHNEFQQRYVLEEVSIDNRLMFDSIEQAMQEIEKNKEQFKDCNLTILLVI